MKYETTTLATEGLTWPQTMTHKRYDEFIRRFGFLNKNAVIKLRKTKTPNIVVHVATNVLGHITPIAGTQTIGSYATLADGTTINVGTHQTDSEAAEALWKFWSTIPLRQYNID